jgi:hypothetical protein
VSHGTGKWLRNGHADFGRERRGPCRLNGVYRTRNSRAVKCVWLRWRNANGSGRAWPRNAGPGGWFSSRRFRHRLCNLSWFSWYRLSRMPCVLLLRYGAWRKAACCRHVRTGRVLGLRRGYSGLGRYDCACCQQDHATRKFPLQHFAPYFQFAQSKTDRAITRTRTLIMEIASLLGSAKGNSKDFKSVHCLLPRIPREDPQPTWFPPDEVKFGSCARCCARSSEE